MGPFEGELAFLLFLGFGLEDKAIIEFDLDDHLAARGTLREGDKNAFGEIFSDLHGDFIGVRCLGCDSKLVHTNVFADGFEHGGACAGR